MTKTNTTAFEKVHIINDLLGRELKKDVVMASYGENEVRFYTDQLHEPELITRLVWFTHPIEKIIDVLQEVTESI